MKTVLCHFYNEEYLLPHWLKHHREIFDHGILINYDSTDLSEEIIREMCPSWSVVKSRNPEFEAVKCDIEVQDYEILVDGWRIALNVTEFLMIDEEELKTRKDDLLISSCMMICPEEMKDVDPSSKKLLIDQFTHGIDTIDYQENELREIMFREGGNPEGIVRSGRRMSMDPKPYFGVHPPWRMWSGPGRHFNVCKDLPPNTNSRIFWYGYAPWTRGSLERKLQIGARLSKGDISLGFGSNHLFTADVHLTNLKILQNYSRDLKKQYFHLSPYTSFQ